MIFRFHLVCSIIFLSVAFVAAAQQNIEKSESASILPTPITNAILQTSNADAISQHLENLLQSTDIKLDQLVSEAESILAYAKDSGLQALEIDAASIIILRLAGTDQQEKFQRLIDNYLLTAINQEANIPLSRMYRGLLRSANISGNHENSVSIKRQLLQLVEKDLPARDEGLSLLSVGINDFHNERYYGALTFLERAMDSFQRNEIEAEIDRVLSMLALVNSRLGNDQRAIDIQIEIAERLRLRSKNISWSIVDYNIASAYFDLKEYPLAKQYAIQSKHVALEFDDDQSVAFANLMLARIEFALSNYVEAMSLSAEAAASFARINNQTREAQALVVQLKSELQLNDLNRAEINVEKLLKIQLTQQSSELDVALLEIKALLAEAKGNTSEALSFHRRYHEASLDSQLNRQSRSIDQLLNELAIDVTENETQYSLQKGKVIELEEKLVQQSHIMLIMAVVAAILMLIVIILYIYGRSHKGRLLRESGGLDLITQGPNQVQCFKAARLAFNQAAIGHYSTILAVIDLDDFSQINVTYGYNVGDQILRQFVSSLRSVSRKQDSFGRIGSDKWLLVCPQSDFDYVNKLLTDLRALYRQSVGNIVTSPDSLTFSAGATTTLVGYANIEEMILAAEKCVAKAKSTGKDRLEFNSP